MELLWLVGFLLAVFAVAFLSIAAVLWIAFKAVAWMFSE